MNANKLMKLTATFLLACMALSASEANEARKALNIVNFVRSADPRPPRAEMISAVREEVALNLKYGFKNTILLQYDALVDPEMMAEALKSDRAKTEFGLWFEMSRPLNEAAGLPWKPKGAHQGRAQELELGLAHQPRLPDGVRPCRTQGHHRRGIQAVQGRLRVLPQERRLVAPRRLVDGLHGEDVRRRRLLHLPRAGQHGRLRPARWLLERRVLPLEEEHALRRRRHGKRREVASLQDAYARPDLQLRQTVQPLPGLPAQ